MSAANPCSDTTIGASYKTRWSVFLFFNFDITIELQNVKPKTVKCCGCSFCLGLCHVVQCSIYLYIYIDIRNATPVDIKWVLGFINGKFNIVD